MLVGDSLTVNMTWAKYIDAVIGLLAELTLSYGQLQYFHHHPAHLNLLLVYTLVGKNGVSMTKTCEDKKKDNVYLNKNH